MHNALRSYIAKNVLLNLTEQFLAKTTKNHGSYCNDCDNMSSLFLFAHSFVQG
jgi:hypothetical protein